MTLKEIRDKIAATKNELRTLVTSAETEEQRASVTTLEKRPRRRGSRAGIVREVGRAATAPPGSSVDRDVDGAGPSEAYEGKRPGSRS